MKSNYDIIDKLKDELSTGKVSQDTLLIAQKKLNQNSQEKYLSCEQDARNRVGETLLNLIDFEDEIITQDISNNPEPNKKNHKKILITLAAIFVIFTITLAVLFSTVLKDTDKDGLIDKREADYGSSIEQPDTDSDGMSDGEEVRLNIDPMNPDSDGDGMIDGKEKLQDTPPDNAESDVDNDGLLDQDDPFPLNPDGDLDGVEDLFDKDPTDPEINL